MADGKKTRYYGIQNKSTRYETFEKFGVDPILFIDGNSNTLYMGSHSKYFDRNIGTIQTLEMIESHPTITICPFLEQCESKTNNSPCQGGNYVGDGYCDDDFNNEQCNWDGGDCCGDNVNRQWCRYCNCNYDLIPAKTPRRGGGR